MNQECRSLINYNFASNKYVKSLVSSYFFTAWKTPNSKLQPSVCCCFAKPLMCYSVLATIHVLVPNVSFLHPSKQNKTKQNNTDITRMKDTAYTKKPGCVDVPVQYRHIESGWHFRCILWLGFKYAWWWKDVAGGFSPLQYQSMLKDYSPQKY